ncbi:MAG: hypothetical protein F6J95_020540 [Leptolyngbya sp. SIO1E4]|nr:hypothetical protein [Leptolyngbya sp. SIO1E4]
MAPLSWFRFIVKRLSFLKKPIPMVSTVFVVILGLFIWEYTTHPEWFGTYSQEGTGPNEDIDLSGLTPEEQAVAADIDNLTLLLNDLGVSPDGMPPLPGDPEAEGEPENLLLQDLLDASAPTEGQQLSGNSNPFDRYLSQYQFLGRPSPGATPDELAASNPNATSFGLFSQSNGAEGSASAVSGGDRTGALERALQAQGAAGASNVAVPSEGSDNEVQSPEGETATPSASESPGSLPTTDGINSQAATIPGVPFPVVPTTPQMSPPPGTTGYIPPASLELMPPIPGRSNTAQSPTGGTATPNPNSAGVPNIPSATGNLNLGVPQVDVSNGAVNPATLPSGATPAPEVPEIQPSPFAVPRPPGSYTGGGYINTFSNPSAPLD